MELSGQVALVTGASGGIGRAVSARLAGEGAAVGLGYSRHREPAQALAADITATGGRAVAVAADLADPHAPGHLVRAVEERLGPVDVSVLDLRVTDRLVPVIPSHDAAAIRAHMPPLAQPWDTGN